MRWRALLVDDEPPARRRLRRLLEPHPQIEVVGEASDLSSATELLSRHAIELIFLDIHLGDASGFELWNRVAVNARVVFVTAYDQYAVRAFERGALDYVLKPVDPERLAHTIDRLPSSPHGDDRLLCLELLPGYRMVRLRDIVCVRAQGDYTLVQLRDGSEELVACSLQSWVERLPVDAYARVHRNAIVGLEFVELVEPSGSAWVAKVRYLADRLNVSRRHLRRLRELLREV